MKMAMLECKWLLKKQLIADQLQWDRVEFERVEYLFPSMWHENDASNTNNNLRTVAPNNFRPLPVDIPTNLIACDNPVWIPVELHVPDWKKYAKDKNIIINIIDWIPCWKSSIFEYKENNAKILPLEWQSWHQQLCGLSQFS